MRRRKGRVCDGEVERGKGLIEKRGGEKTIPGSFYGTLSRACNMGG